MQAMDVTPRELRDTEIREAWRGYKVDEVDELLERAAQTLEAAEERIRALTERVAALEGEAGRSREDGDVLQRTLLLAQRAADEAVAEAEERARRTVEDAESKATSMVSAAEANARRVAEEERRRLESDVLDLAARREALVSDVDALERYDADYRDRLRAAIEADLERLANRPPAGAGARPALHDVVLPPPPEAMVRSPAAPAAVEPPLPAAPEAPEPEGPGPGATGAEPPGAGGPEVSEVDLPAAEASVEEPPPPPEETGSPGEPEGGAPGGGILFEHDEPIEAEVLDDDAFFATLREAVRDDAPLGPREDQGDATVLLEGEEESDDRFGGLFKRRR